MTKKSEKLVETMKAKMEDVAWRFEYKIIDFSDMNHTTKNLLLLERDL